jgi:hypothetical protein
MKYGGAEVTSPTGTTAQGGRGDEHSGQALIMLSSIDDGWQGYGDLPAHHLPSSVALYWVEWRESGLSGIEESKGMC